MAITFVNAGAEGSAASGNITLGAPASPQNGDIWIAVIHSSDQVAHSMSGDWTQIVQGNGGGTTSRLSVWWHRYNGVTPSLVVTHSAGQSPIGGIAAFRGCVATGSPVGAVGSIGTGTTATIAHPGIAISGEIMHLLCNGAADDNNRTLVTNYTNALEDSGAGTNNAYVTTAGTPDGSVCLMYRLVTNIANSTINMTQAAADPFAGVQIALVGPAEASFSSAGVAAVSGVGVAVTERTASADGLAAVSGTSAVIVLRTFTSEGIGAASAVSAQVVGAAGSSSGVAAVIAEALSVIPRQASAGGIATAIGEAVSVLQRVASSAASANATAEAVAVTERSASASGLASVTGISLAVVEASGGATGLATVNGVPVAVVEVVAQAASGSTADGIINAITERIASAIATAGVTGVAVQIVQADANAAGIATVLGDGTTIGGGETEFHVGGASSALADALAVVVSEGNAQGVASVLGAVAAIVSAFGTAAGVATVSGVGAGVAPPQPNSQQSVTIHSRMHVAKPILSLHYYKCIISYRNTDVHLADRNHNAYISLGEASMSQITRYHGDTAPDILTVYAPNGSPLNIAGHQFVMTIVRTREGGEALFSIDGVITNAAGGVVQFTPTIQQAELAPGKYFYGVRMWDTSGAILTILTGQYTIRPSMHGS